MESPVVVDKPPEYHGKNDRGFPFDEEEGTGAWSELAARHPDIAARLRQRPATWARKRRPSSQDAADDFGDGFGGFDRFPFDDIPQEFREHFPTHWNRRFGSREDAGPQQQSAAPQQSPQQQTAGTQTEQTPEPSQEGQQTQLPQYGLRNTVDLGQKSAVDPSLVDSEDRSQRSVSAPPDSRSNNQNCTNNMSGQNHQEHAPPQHEPSNVRHIPIFVEGRDEPVINKSDHGAHYADTKPAFSPQQQPHIDREQYFADDGPPSFHHTPNFSRAFGTPFNKGFRQGPQPFVQQKVYPQTAFARGGSPQRSQSPKAQMYPEDQFAKVPVHHEQSTPRAEPPSRPQQKQQQKQSPQQQQPPSQQHQPPPQQHQPPPQQHQPPPQQQEPAPQPKPAATANDPITLILSIQTDVLNLMTDVENFTGTKKDKKYMFLDEMLTRNLIKLDNIETDGKENIRQARKEAIKCIQKCIAVLEAKADNKGAATPQPQDIEMKDSTENGNAAQQKEVKENGEVEMKDATKDEANAEQQTQQSEQVSQVEQQITQPQEEKSLEESKEDAAKPQAADTRPEDKQNIDQTEVNDEQKSNENIDKKSPKKGAKTAKKRDKSKDNKETVVNKDNVEEKKDTDSMQVDNKGDKDSQAMEVEGATASQ